MAELQAYIIHGAVIPQTSVATAAGICNPICSTQSYQINSLQYCIPNWHWFYFIAGTDV
jgi:hypothetical protein